jgi:hypothetical protein
MKSTVRCTAVRLYSCTAHGTAVHLPKKWARGPVYCRSSSVHLTKRHVTPTHSIDLVPRIALDPARDARGWRRTPKLKRRGTQGKRRGEPSVPPCKHVSSRFTILGAVRGERAAAIRCVAAKQPQEGQGQLPAKGSRRGGCGAGPQDMERG